MQQILCKIIEKRGGIKKMRYFAKKPKSSAVPAGRSWAYRGMLCCGGLCGRAMPAPTALWFAAAL